VDVTLGLGPGRLRDVLDVCGELGLNPLPDDVEAFVARTFVLPAEDAVTGIRVDLIFSTTPYEAQAISRVVRRKGPDLDWVYLRGWAGQFAGGRREGGPPFSPGRATRVAQASRTITAGASRPIPGSYSW
jgi:hypothetical protein